METETGSSQVRAALPSTGNEAVFAVLFAASFSHLLNDTIQSLIPGFIRFSRIRFSSISLRSV
jgi:hypothetical protein